MEQFAIQYGFLVMPICCAIGLIYAYQKDQEFFEGDENPIPNQCACGSNTFTYLGLQEAPRFNLDLFNCTQCKTTHAVKVSK